MSFDRIFARLERLEKEVDCLKQTQRILLDKLGACSDFNVSDHPPTIEFRMNPDRALSILENTYGTYYEEG